MGPPSEDGGNVLGTNAAAAKTAMLQWGRRPRTAEIRDLLGRPMERKGLQWGRRPRTAEISYVTSYFLGGMNASMGPPSEDGGNPRASFAVAPRKPLQWGRRPRTAEMGSGQGHQGY